MEDQERSIEDLYKKVERLVQQQQFLFTELQKVQKSLAQVKTTDAPPITKVEKVEPLVTTPTEVIDKKEPVVERVEVVHPVREVVPQEAKKPINTTPPPKQPKVKTPIEDFIGTNLLNKIGIAVLVIGIGFGTKYAIDHDMLS